MIQNQLDHIISNIWLGDSDDSENLDLLLKTKIERILICGNELNANFPKNFQYKQLDITEFEFDENIIDLFNQAVEYMEGGNCFVHCRAGMQRSPTFVIAYLIKKHKMNYNDAHAHAKKIRSYIYLPSQYINALKKYEQVCNQEIKNTE